IDREGDEQDGLPGQVVLQLGHGGADLGTLAGAAREDERGDPDLVEQVRARNGSAAPFGQRELTHRTVVIVRWRTGPGQAREADYQAEQAEQGEARSARGVTKHGRTFSREHKEPGAPAPQRVPL